MIWCTYIYYHNRKTNQWKWILLNYFNHSSNFFFTKFFMHVFNNKFSMLNFIRVSRRPSIHVLDLFAYVVSSFDHASTIVLYLCTRIKILVETDVWRACKRVILSQPKFITLVSSQCHNSWNLLQACLTKSIFC